MGLEPTPSSSTSRGDQVSRVLVVGGGSAGFLSAITLKARLPTLEVTVLHSSDIPIIGVGEGTTLTMPIYLHGYLGIDPAAFHAEVRPTYKLGIRFLWGPRPRFHYTFSPQLDGFLAGMPRANGYYAYEDFDYADLNAALAAHDRAFPMQSDGGPRVGTDVAYHLENETFVRFLEGHARKIGIGITDDRIAAVEQDESGITSLVLASGQRAKADLYVDCSGFRSLLLGETLGEPFESYASSLFCDRAVAGGWARTDEPLLPFTTAETMDAGWAWRIEHDDLINRGYVYSSAFLDDASAEAELRRKNPKIGNTRVIRFASGAHRRSWVKNVVALGNSAGFVEPLEATALAVICDHAAKLVHCLADSWFTIEPVSRDYYNRYCQNTWQAIRRFLALHYKFNTRIDTPFWRHCWNEIDLAGAEQVVDYYQACGPATLWSGSALGPGDPFTWEGYLVMFVGQRVPFRRQVELSPAERDVWRSHQEKIAREASSGLTMRQALDMIRSPNWRWKPDFYAKSNRW